MLKIFLVTNFRNLLKNKIHTAINSIGLSLGMSCAIFILVMVSFELRFDNYHYHSDRIYRVVVKYHQNNELSYSSGLPYPVAEAMRQDFPDLDYATIVDCNSGDPVLGVKEGNGLPRLFKEGKVTFVDPDYFKMFSYSWLEGSPDALLREKTVVLTESVARKYFGSTPAMNKVISYNGKFDLVVSGVVNDPPLNTNLPFRILISNRLGADKHSWDRWTSSSGAINTYVQIKPGIKSEDLEHKMQGWHMKYFTGVEEEGRNRTYFLQPLNDVHFDKRFGSFSNIVSRESLGALSLIGMLLLFSACINFVNLNTVLIVNRSREVGIRKVLGSSKAYLVFQFLGETFLIACMALIISMPLLELALNNADFVLGYNLPFRPSENGIVILLIFTIPIIVTLLAGLYPACAMASFQPIRALKNRIYGSSGGTTIRRALIGFQLVVSQGLVICTIIILQQIRFFNTQPLGLNTNSVVEFEIPEQRKNDLVSMKSRMEGIAGVEDVTLSNTGAVAGNYWGGDFETTVNGQKIKTAAQVKFIDEDYLKTYQITLVAGANIPASDSAHLFLVNEALVRAMGLKNAEEAIGVPIVYWGSKKGTVTGVIKNFHSGPLREKIMPVIFMTGPEFYNTCAVRLRTQDVKAVMDAIGQEWKTTFPQYVFEYSFLDDTIRNFYEEERRMSRMIMAFSLIVVLIGSIGLLGLVSFMVSKRTKEVGIRKTLGASTGSIMAIFSREFIWLIGVSFAIAGPAAYYSMEGWLENFAYRVQPGAFTFISGAALSFLIVFLTVGVISYRAATANPVDALRNE